MTKGGKRIGAGRKPLRTTTGINKTIRFTEAEWNEITTAALICGMKPSEYVRTKALQ